MTMIEMAIAHLQEENCKNTTTVESMHFNNMAIHALRKRSPMLVNHERTFWHYYHYCPVCSEQLKMEGLNYCDKCGQHLDWSNYHEELQNAKRTHRRATKRIY